MSNLERARFAYEQLGLTEPEIAIRYSLPIKMVNEAVREWRTPSISALVSDSVDAAKEILTANSIAKQLSQFLKYKDLEDEILDRLLARIQSIDDEDPTAVRQIQQAVSAITTLKQSDPIQLVADSLASGEGVTVNIQNNVT